VFDSAADPIIHIGDKVRVEGGESLQIEAESDLKVVETRLFPRARVPRAARCAHISDHLRDPADYIQELRLGSGNQWNLWQMAHIENGSVCVGKEFHGPLQSLNQNQKGASDLLMREVEALTRLWHPAIIGIVGWAQPREGQHPYIFLEYMEHGSLAKFMADRKQYESLTGTQKAKIVMGIVLGMRYLHSSHVIHRDLHPGTLFLDRKFDVKIGNFSSMKADMPGLSQTMNVGTPRYTAPETRYVTPELSTKVDVFSFGITVWELLTGKKAYGDQKLSDYQLLRRIDDTGRGKKVLRPDLTAIDPGLAPLLAMCWSSAPEARPEFEEIFEMLKSTGWDFLEDAEPAEVAAFVNRVVELQEKYPADPEVGDEYELDVPEF
jgi:serine/threonine protein kinase